MQIFDENLPGASRDPEKALKGEILATLADLQNRYDGTRLELSWAVLGALWQHIERHHGTTALCEFYEGTIDITNEQVDLIRAIIDDDSRKRLN